MFRVNRGLMSNKNEGDTAVSPIMFIYMSGDETRLAQRLAL